MLLFVTRPVSVLSPISCPDQNCHNVWNRNSPRKRISTHGVYIQLIHRTSVQTFGLVQLSSLAIRKTRKNAPLTCKSDLVRILVSQPESFQHSSCINGIEITRRESSWFYGVNHHLENPRRSEIAPDKLRPAQLRVQSKFYRLKVR